MSVKSQAKKPKFTPEQKATWRAASGSRFTRRIPSTEYERFRSVAHTLYRYDAQGRRIP